MSQLNPNWSIPLPNLADVGPIDPARASLALGYYAVKINNTSFMAPQNAEQRGGIVIEFTVLEEGEFKGRDGKTTLFLGDKKGNLGALKGLLMSIGATAQQLGAMAGQPLGPNSLNGKMAYLYSDGGNPEGEAKAYANYTFVPQEFYAKGKAQQTAKGASGNMQPAGGFGGAPATPSIGGAPPAFGAPAAQALGFGAIPQPGQPMGGVAALGQNLGGQNLGAPPPSAGQQTVSF